MLTRRDLLKSLAASVPVVATPSFLRSLFPQERSSQSPFQDVTSDQKEAVRKGLDWLTRNQSRSGAIGTTCQVAFTSLACLAFMANGSTPTRGLYARPLREGLRFILRCCGPSGYINEAAGRGMGGSGMHGHGYAAWFLGELLGMCGGDGDFDDDAVKEKLVKAVKLIENCQDPNGGWYYEPNPGGHEGSVTVTQAQALRAARNVGVVVDSKVVTKGIDYIKKSTGTDGTVAYSLGQRGGGGSYALTAAGMCVFCCYGLYDAPEVKRGMAALMEFLSNKRPRGGAHDYYAHLYAGQAAFFSKGIKPEYWTTGYEVVRKELLSGQDKKGGGWIQDSYGGAFGTACACLVLQIPFRFLPMFQD